MTPTLVFYALARAPSAHAEEPPPNPAPLPKTEVPPEAPPQAPLVPPVLLAPVEPVYPPEAAGAAGEVRLVVRVDLNGAVTDARAVSDAPAVFVPAAVEAARRLRFTPATREGVPVEVELEVRFGFAPPPPEPPPDDGDVLDVVAERAPTPPRAAGDFHLEVETLRPVPRHSATELLTLAPGVFLTQAGGSGDPEQVFLRGFDAREGQDIAFTLEGIPLNDVANPHGHGLADLHFLVPEAVSRVRVLEGPFDPRQGDFAVAGSADYALGLDAPGLFTKAQAGSFGAWRAVNGWRSAEDRGTLFVSEVAREDGYGDNRASARASALGRVEGGGETRRWSALALAYGARWDSAGLVRLDDVEAGRIDRFGTMDDRQGGDSSRLLVGATTEGDEGDASWRLQAWAARRAMTMRTNYTGFLLDDRRPGESPHAQRGDLLEQGYLASSAGLSGEAHRHFVVGPADGSVSTGIAARIDVVDGTVRRLRAQDGAPYRVDLDGLTRQGDVAPWVDVDLSAWERVDVHGGVRIASLTYALEDRCAAHDTWYPGADTDDVNCADEDRFGARLRVAGRSAQGVAVAPRVSVDVRIVDAISLSGAYGRGVRSVEATSLSDGEEAPFAQVDAGEMGLVLRHGDVGWVGRERVIGFVTHVDKDMVFDEESGRNTIAGETLRVGALLDGELARGGTNLRGSVTWTRATFGDELPPNYARYNSDRVPGMAIPYVPPLVARLDLAHRWSLAGVEVSHGLGMDALAPRPLPQGEQSDPVFTVDLGTSARRGAWTVAADVSNLLDARYNLAEYNFSSFFPASSGASFPTRHVSPGAPRAFLLSLTWQPDAETTP